MRGATAMPKNVYPESRYGPPPERHGFPKARGQEPRRCDEVGMAMHPRRSYQETGGIIIS